MAYTGPIPPAPTAASTPTEWQNWWAFQTVAGNMRYEDERAARVLVLDKQHTEKLAAEARCAEAQVKLAAAQTEMARVLALTHTTPPAEAPAKPWTEEQLVRAFMLEMVGTVPAGTTAMQRAQAYSALLKFNFPAPTGVIGAVNSKSSG